MDAILFFKESKTIFNIIKNVIYIKGGDIKGSDEEVGGINIDIIDFIVTDIDTSELIYGDKVPEGIVDYSYLYKRRTSEELEAAVNLTQVAVDELLVGNGKIADYLAARIIEEAQKYEFVILQRPDLKVDIDDYLISNGREDLIISE
ncbi:hypothetical protein ACK8P5_21050 [Paenibacillus sp. EC2-1]|uniref:hypothetical protein n=1 Tax=Paenibacillus sp. EC2-1 TaxID=3388665 RepID=UPI003BEECC34